MGSGGIGGLAQKAIEKAIEQNPVQQPELKQTPIVKQNNELSDRLSNVFEQTTQKANQGIYSNTLSKPQMPQMNTSTSGTQNFDLVSSLNQMQNKPPERQGGK